MRAEALRQDTNKEITLQVNKDPVANLELKLIKVKAMADIIVQVVKNIHHQLSE